MSDERDEWVGPSEAAEILGVHPTTIRTWADRGDLPSRRTAGGHRRFRRSDLLRRDKPATASPPAEAEMMVQSALGRARMRFGEGQLDDQEWFRNFDEDARQRYRTLGRELLTVLTTFLTSPGSRQDTLAHARHIGEQQGSLALDQRLTLSDSVRAFFFFRDLLNDSVIQLADTLSLRTANEWGEKLREVNHFADAVLLALIERYETT